MPVLHVEFLMSQSRKIDSIAVSSCVVTFLQGWLCSISCVIVNYIYLPPLPEEDNSTGTIIGGFKADVYLILRVLQSDRYPFVLTNGFRPTPLHI